ncbi:MAG: mechanosensitive ion channel [Magnetospirillum sp.]|nr:mechanosensitive ion channel [Magnetospirillum sp.]
MPPSFFRARHYGALLCLLATLLSPPAVAQPPQDVELEKLVSTLEDDKSRAHLVGQLKTLLHAQAKVRAEADDGPLARLSERLDILGDQVTEAVDAARDLPRLAEWLVGQAADELVRRHLGEVLLRLAAVLGAGIAVDQLLAALIVRWRRGRPSPAKPEPLALALAVGGRTLADLLPVAAFAAAGWATALMFRLTGPEKVAVPLAIAAYAAVRLVMVAARTLASPRLPSLRLLPVDDETAEYLVIWVRRLAGFGVFGWFAVEAARLLGLPAGAHLFVLKSLGLAVATMMAIFVLQNRNAVAEGLRRPSERPLFGERLQAFRTRLADVWHVLAVLYIAAVYLVWALQVRGGFEFMLRATVLTAVILALSAGLSAVLRRAIDRGFAIGQDTRDRFPLLEARANRYLPILHLVLRGTVGMLTLLALAQAWGMDILGALASQPGKRVLSSGVSIAVVLVAALVVWELVHGAIERYLTATDSDGHARERSSRARTLLPLARNAVFLVLLVLVSLIVLSELGVNIAPLLAGAGVVGIAVGFGAQKLVQDIITGAFILFEDTIAVGDAVKVGEHAGAVEAISIRAIRLRDAQGSLHTIPFSAVTTVVNLTKGFSYAVMDVGVAYREDTDRVSAVLAGIGAEMQADPRWAAGIVEPLEVLGVERFDASAVVIRARIKTLPAEKWPVLREFNRRVKKRFDAEGIEMPFPQTTVWFGNAPATPNPLAPPSATVL